MAHKSFAKTVIEALTSEVLVGNSEVSVGELSCALHLQTRKDHKRLLNTLSDLSRSGKIERVRQGVYVPATSTSEPDKREVMWRVLRMRRGVTIADLQEMAGVSPAYAKEWLAMLVKRGIAMRVTPANQNHPHSWRLIKNDLVEMPVDEEKAAKYRALRKKKKEAFKALDEISEALGKVRKVINSMEEE